VKNLTRHQRRQLVRAARAERKRHAAQVAFARLIVADYRAQVGFKRSYASILQEETISKLEKSALPTLSLSLNQANTSGVVNTCPFSTPECRRFCVAESGHGGRPSVYRGRLWRTALWAEQPEVFKLLVRDELLQAVIRHDGRQILCRLNAYSDILWEDLAPEWFDGVDSIGFYDYTKWPVDRRPDPVGVNYRLTRSATERTTVEDVAVFLKARATVAVVVDQPIQHWDPADVPTTWNGFPAINGDLHDDRHNDPEGVVVLLGAKRGIANSPMAHPLSV